MGAGVLVPLGAFAMTIIIVIGFTTRLLSEGSKVAPLPSTHDRNHDPA